MKGHELKLQINYDGNLRIGFCLVCGGRAKMNGGEISKSEVWTTCGVCEK